MTNQEVDRRIAFIIEQQAQFTSNIQQLREAQSVLQATQVQTEQVVARLAHVTLEGFKDVNAKINLLVDSQIHTDQNLRNLIAVVERYF
jgi:hypothetical protein